MLAIPQLSVAVASEKFTIESHCSMFVGQLITGSVVSVTVMVKLRVLVFIPAS